jgi:Domain of unknown function (DUF5667)
VLVSAFDTNDSVALDRLEDLLEAYREARLAPPGSVLARIRANVLAQAAAASAATAAASRLRLVEPDSSRTRGWLPPRFARVAFGFGFAAALTLGTSAAVFAAPPGSPFYNARVFIESAFLPTQLDARLVAHEDLLAERLHEAEAAAASGDTVGLAAALAAYQAEVDDATADVGDDPTRLAHLEDVLANHTAVLTALAATLPEQSSIDNAIENSSKAITKLQDKSHPAHPSHPPQGGGGSGGGSGGGGDGQGEN